MLTPHELVQQLNWRYAVKKFDPSKKIPAEMWHALEQSLVLTPSSFGLQPWKFLVVKTPELREQLVAASWKQAQVRDASHLVVFAIKKNMGPADAKKLIDRTVELRGGAAVDLAGYEGMMSGFLSQPAEKFRVDEWSARQVYIAIGQFMLAAAVLGIDSCPLEGIAPAQYDELLGLSNSDYATCVVAAAGYRAADDKYATLAKIRYVTSDVLEYK